MATYEFESVVDEQQHLALPANIPAGAVHVRLVFHEQSSAKNEVQAGGHVFQRFMDLPVLNRSREDIDAYLREERDSWE